MEELHVDIIMHHQPILNIATTGHVAHGKSTVVKCLSSKITQQYSKERESNKTLRTGYANVKFWHCSICDAPRSYSSSDSSVMTKRCNDCNSELKLVNHVSFVDNPGHEDLIPVMLNGSSVADYAVLVENGHNTDIPAPQTAEHYIATRIAKIPTVLILMNKIDLINKKKALEQIDVLKKYITTHLDTKEVCPPIIPISATLGKNIDVLCQLLSGLKPPVTRNPHAQFKMICIRSFDINKPGSDILKLSGGVIGGTILRGMLKIGDRINIYPGMIRRIPIEDKILEGPEFKYEPIIGTVLSIKSETNELNYAISGGLLGIQLTIDPAFARNDHLVGGLVLKTLDVEKSETEGSGSEPIVTIYDKIIVKVTSLLISEEELNKIMKDQEEIDKKEKDQRKDQSKIIININSNNIECSVHKYKKSKKELFLFLNTPIAIDSTDNIATIMHKNKSNNIIGRGIVVDGIQCIRL